MVLSKTPAKKAAAVRKAPAKKAAAPAAKRSGRKTTTTALGPEHSPELTLLIAAQTMYDDLGVQLSALNLALRGTAEDADEEEDEDPTDARRAELRAMSERALRKMCKDAGYPAADVAKAGKDDLVETLIQEEAQQAAAASAGEADEDEDDDAEDEDDDEEDAEESEGYTAEQLNDMGIRQLKKLAVEEFQVAKADLTGLDKAAVIALLMDSDDEEEDEEPGYDEDTLNAMSLAEVRKIAKEEYKLRIPRGTDQDGIVEMILEAQEEAEDEDDEDDDLI